jgi:hypothetical protein
MEAFLRLLIERRAELETAVMTNPPSSWDEFQKRLGRWSELCLLINMIEGKIQEADNG